MKLDRYRVKNLTTQNDEVLYDSTEPNAEILYVEIGDVQYNEGIQAKTPYTFETAPSRARRIVRDGDVIVSTVRTYLKAVAPITNPEPNLIVSTGFSVLRSKKKFLHPKYTGYMIQSDRVLGEIVSRSVGVSYPAVRPEDIGDIEVHIPPLTIQKTIAAYLDKETARIDDLIAKKERQIELLQEKRQAIITRAVTKGLDPNAKMVDSGVDWIGEIPEGWEIRKLCFSATFISGATPDKGNDLYWDGSIPWVSPKDMKRRYIEDSIDHLSEEAMKAAHLRLIPKGTVIVVVRGMILVHSFPVAITTAELTINQDIKAILFDENFHTEYAALLLEGFEKVTVSLYVETSAHGTKALRLDNWKDFPLLCPPIEEQKEIAAFAHREIEAFNHITTTINQSISLLREYRSSLITAAVSGQIDVSNMEAAR